MNPIRTRKTTGIYGAPPGHDDTIGGLPFWRAQNEYGGTTVYIVWTFDEGERRAIAEGAVLVLGILGPEPISPVSLSLRAGDDEHFSEVDAIPAETRPPRPPKPPADREMG